MLCNKLHLHLGYITNFIYINAMEQITFTFMLCNKLHLLYAMYQISFTFTLHIISEWFDFAVSELPMCRRRAWTLSPFRSLRYIHSPPPLCMLSYTPHPPCACCVKFKLGFKVNDSYSKLEP